MLKVVNKSDNDAEIYISGDIVDDADGEMLRDWWGLESGYEFPANIKNQLDELKGKDLKIYINSDGGMVNAGIAMANMIARHDGHTIAIVDGWCCSIATQIFFSADERQMPSNAYLMIHKPFVSAGGNADDFRKTADILDIIQEGIETTYRKAKLENISDEEITQMVNDETWLTGEEASKIFDIKVTDASKAVACAGSHPVNFRKAPKGIRFAARDKPENVENVDKPVNKSQDNEIEKAKINIALAMAKGVLKDEKE